MKIGQLVYPPYSDADFGAVIGFLTKLLFARLTIADSAVAYLENPGRVDRKGLYSISETSLTLTSVAKNQYQISTYKEFFFLLKLTLEIMSRRPARYLSQIISFRPQPSPLPILLVSDLRNFRLDLQG